MVEDMSVVVNVISNACNEPTSCIVQPIGTHRGEVMYVGCICFRDEVGFLNYDDICMCERSVEKQRDVYTCFIDYSKAFHTVKHESLVELLQSLDVDKSETRLLTNLYWKQTAAVRCGDNISEWLDIKQGVRQGCVASPHLFALYTEMIMRELDDMDGFRIGGTVVNNLRYADDTVIIAESEEQLQRMINVVVTKSEEKGLYLNSAKSFTMVFSKASQIPTCNINVHGKILEQVHSFAYLEVSSPQMQDVRRSEGGLGSRSLLLHP